MKDITPLKQRRYSKTEATRSSINPTKVRLNIDLKESEVKLLKDATSIISTKKIKFIAQEIFRYSLYILPAINQLQDHILQISKWQQLLITNFQESGDINLLIVFIQSNKKNIITSDESKSRKLSKGTWTIADETGREIFTGNNLYFGEINQISSH